MSAANREENRQVALILTNTLGTSVVYPTGVKLTDSTPMHVAIVDGSGDQITSFGGGTQYTDGGVPPAHPIGSTLEWSDGSNWQTVSTAKPLPVTATFSPSGTQDVNITKVAGSALSLGQALAAASLPVVLTADQIITLTPPSSVTANAGTNLNTSLLALESGGNLATLAGAVSSSKVNVNISSGSIGNTSFASTIADGADVTLGAKADAKSTATDATPITVMQVLKQISASVQAPPSQAVTNAGTFLVQAAQSTASSLNATVVGTGTFAVQATPVTQADTFMLGGVNVKEINGVTPLMGVGATGTGAQRTVPANDMGKTLVSKGGNASSSGNNTLVTAGSNRLKVYAFSLSTVSTTAVTCIFQSGASGTELWRVTLQTPASVAGGANLVVQPPAWIFATASATLLNLNLSAAVSVDWSVSYYDEA